MTSPKSLTLRNRPDGVNASSRLRRLPRVVHWPGSGSAGRARQCRSQRQQAVTLSGNRSRSAGGASLGPPAAAPRSASSSLTSSAWTPPAPELSSTLMFQVSLQPAGGQEALSPTVGVVGRIRRRRDDSDHPSPSRWGHVAVTREVEDEPFAGWPRRGREVPTVIPQHPSAQLAVRPAR